VYYFREDASVTGMQAHKRRDQGQRPSTLQTVTALCLILVAVLVVVQVMHLHRTESDADHCPLCIVMHSVVPIAVMVAEVFLARVKTPALDFLEVHAIVRRWHPILFTRPPPTSC
jgi:hypothetical protein